MVISVDGAGSKEHAVTIINREAGRGRSVTGEAEGRLAEAAGGRGLVAAAPLRRLPHNSPPAKEEEVSSSATAAEAPQEGGGQLGPTRKQQREAEDVARERLRVEDWVAGLGAARHLVWH